MKFSYIEDDIVVYSLLPPRSDLTFEEKISYLKENTRLQFKAVSSKYYTISNDKKIDKPLCAYLLDAVTNVPIENASIEVQSSNISATSDSHGFFQLPAASSNTILIKHLGYESKAIKAATLYTNYCPKIQMVP
ncbi:MAG TPA: hypothetical protein VGB43_02625, partial [Flavobacterium sp.]